MLLCPILALLSRGINRIMNWSWMRWENMTVWNINVTNVLIKLATRMYYQIIIGLYILKANFNVNSVSLCVLWKNLSLDTRSQNTWVENLLLHNVTIRLVTKQTLIITKSLYIWAVNLVLHFKTNLLWWWTLSLKEERLRLFVQFYRSHCGQSYILGCLGGLIFGCKDGSFLIHTAILPCLDSSQM